MEYRRTYEDWLNNDYFDEATKEELRSIASDENEIKERFYTDLAFGTAGLRGIIGSGTNMLFELNLPHWKISIYPKPLLLELTPACYRK